MSRFKTTKKCPRCGEKVGLETVKCPDCGLIFARLEFGSNKLAKKNILAGKRDEVVYNRAFPKDLKRWKVLLLTIFLGIFGAHNLYVGRFGKGIFMLIAGILSVASITFVSHSFTDTLIAISVIPSGIMGFMWLFDIADICIGRYKVPISIKMEEVKK